MAKQKSIIKIQGSIDDMTFYQMNGKNFVKKKSVGMTKEQMNSDPNFKRTKENSQEFSGATAAASGIRIGFINVPQLMDSSFMRRLVSVCREVMNKSDGTRGQRPFLPALHKEVFLNLSLQKNSLLHSVFKAPYTITVPEERTSAELQIPAFSPANLVEAPQGATHFRILFQISVVSPYQYKPESKKYEPEFVEANGMYKLETSDYVSLDVTIPSIEAVLPDIATLAGKLVLLVCVGIEFYQLAGTSYYRLSSGDAMKVAAAK